jgi:hypothetical protein
MARLSEEVSGETASSSEKRLIVDRYQCMTGRLA